MLEKQNKYSIRKLTVGAASVLIGASFFAVNGKTVKADTVNNTNNVDVNKVVQESTGEKAPESTQDGLLKGTDKIEKNSSIERGMNANTNDAPVNQDDPAVKDSQHSGGVDASNVQANQDNTGVQLNTSSNRVDGTLQTSAPAKQGVPAIGTIQKQDNTVNNGVKAPETQTLNLKSLRSIKLNAVNLQDSKVQTQNATTNGGFDEATWGKLDVNSWKGQAENGVYQLTDYTGDLAHIIVPNAADFAAAGKDIGGLQVGIDADTTHSWFEKGDPKTIVFSKTGGEKVKAVGGDWTAAFTGYYDRHKGFETKSSSLAKFDGNNLDVSNVTGMSYMFGMDRLVDLTGLTNWDVSNVTSMDEMFDDNQISNLSPLANWDVGNVTDMNSMFVMNSLTDLKGLDNWNVSKVTNMGGMFDVNQLTDLTGLAKWDVGNVTNMNGMFTTNHLTDLTGLSNWNVGNVTSMDNMFSENQLTDLTGLAKWNVGNVTDMSHMFTTNQLTKLAGLSNWNVGNVTDMSYMFADNQLTDLTDLTNWNVGNVGVMEGMFLTNQLTDLTSLANWDVNKVVDMYNMFADNHIAFANFAKWNFDQIITSDPLYNFISQDSNAIILVKDAKDQTKLSDALQTAANNLSFKNASATDTASMPTVLVATDKEAARRQLLDQINQKVQDYQKVHPNMGVIPVTQLNSLPKLVDLANAKFNVVPNITVTVHFFDDIGTNQDNTPKDITLNNQVVGQALTIDAIKDNPELANYNLVPGASYTVAENTPWLVHLTHKTSEHAESLPATRTICVHRPDGTTQTTVQTIGYKYTVTHDLVTNQDFNSEPIFDKDTTETVVTTVDKNGKSTSQTDKSTVFYTKASDGKYYTFNSFKLPTFPGYKIHMTAESSGIEISYARQHLNAINFVDSTDPSNIVKTYNVSGFTGQTVATDISNNIPENWEIVPGIIAPETIAYTSNDQEDAPINIKIQHKVVDVTTGDGTSIDISRNIYVGKTDFTGSTVGQELKKLETQTVTLHRTGTMDLVTGEVKWNPYSSGTFEAIDAPTIPGYTLSNPDDCNQLTVDGSSNVRDIYLVYKPNKHTQVFNYVDKNGTVVGTYSVDGYTDQTFPVDTNYIMDNIPSGWMQVPGSTYPSSITFGPDDPAPINVQVQHKYVDVTTGYGTTMDISRDIYVGKTDFSGSTAGQELKKLETQTVTLHRTGTMDLVTDEINWNPYTSGTFEAISAPVMPGYTLSNPNDCKPLTVDGSLITDGISHVDDVYLVYKPNKHAQVFNYVDKNGTVEGTYSVDGYTDQTFPVDTNYIMDNIPSGWMQVPGSTYPLTLTFGPNDPAPINVQVQSRYVDVTTGDGTTVDIHRNIYIDKRDMSDSTLSSEKIGTQTITLHRTGTKDLVTGEIEWNPYSSGTFEAISAPTMPGFTLSNPNDCTPLTVDGSLITDGTSHVDDVHLIYNPSEHQQVFNYVDKNGTVVGTHKTDVYTGLTVTANDIVRYDPAPAGYQIVPGSIPSSITFGPDGSIPIVIHVQEIMHSTSDGPMHSESDGPTGDMFTSGFVIMPTNSATNFAIMPTDSTSLTLPKIADSVQVPQPKNVQKEDDVIQRTVKPHAVISKQELDSLVKTAALPSVKLNKQNLKELKQIFVNNNLKDLRSISWKLQDSVLSSSTPLYTLSNSSNSIMLPHLTGYKFKLIKRGTGENSVSFVYSKDKNYKYVFNIAFKDNVMYFTVLTPNKAHNKLTVKQVYKVHNQKELANILSLYL